MSDAAKPPKPETSIPKGALRPYFIRYVFVLIGLYLLLAFVRVYILPSTSLSAVGYAVPFGAALFPLDKFLKQEARIPSEEEEVKLADGFMYIAMIIQIPLTLLAVSLGALEQTPDRSTLTFWLIVAFLIVLWIALNYLFIRLYFHMGLAKRAKKLGIIPDEEAG